MAGQCCPQLAHKQLPGHPLLHEVGNGSYCHVKLTIVPRCNAAMLVLAGADGHQLTHVLQQSSLRRSSIPHEQHLDSMTQYPSSPERLGVYPQRLRSLPCHAVSRQCVDTTAAQVPIFSFWSARLNCRSSLDHCYQSSIFVLDVCADLPSACIRDPWLTAF